MVLIWCRINFLRQYRVAPTEVEERNAALVSRGSRECHPRLTNTLPRLRRRAQKRVSLTCSAPSIRTGNDFVATQTSATYVRWDWTTTVCLTGCHWYTNTPSSRQPGKNYLRWTKSVFVSTPPTLSPSRLSNHLSAPTLRIKTSLIFFYFCFLKKRMLITKEEKFKISTSLVCMGKVWQSDRQMYMCFVFQCCCERSVWA